MWRDGNHWAAKLTDLPVGNDQTKGKLLVRDRTWRGLLQGLREGVAELLDVPIDSFRVTVAFADPEIENAVREALTARKEARDASEVASKKMYQAVTLLAKTASLRDIGALLGYSYQYIRILLAEKDSS